VLDDIQRRALLVDPAGEDPRPALVGALDVDLDEGAGQLLGFPGGRRLAGPQADDDILEADRLARTQSQVADDAVALVEQAEDGDALGHRRHSGLVGRGAWHLDGDGIALGWLTLASVATGKRGNRRHVNDGLLHARSGVQAL
jgi:hypothetical protein